MSAAPKFTPGKITDAKVQREHRRLLLKWAFGKASKAEILRCIELDRREQFVAERAPTVAASMNAGRAARAALAKVSP